jgi:hypothetical protein
VLNIDGLEQIIDIPTVAKQNIKKIKCRKETTLPWHSNLD